MSIEEVEYMENNFKYPDSMKDKIWEKAFIEYNVIHWPITKKMLNLNCRPCYPRVLFYFKSKL